MTVRYDPDFLRKLKKHDVRIRKRFKARIELFVEDPNNAQLNNHSLREEWQGYRSIDVTSDYRAIYTEKDETGAIVAYFVEIGTHKELYK